MLLTNQTCCKMNTSQSADEYYYVGTGIVPHSVYIVSCIYMAIVFVIGFIANIGIFIIFVSSPLVSCCVLSDQSRFKILPLQRILIQRFNPRHYRLFDQLILIGTRQDTFYPLVLFGSDFVC